MQVRQGVKGRLLIDTVSESTENFFTTSGRQCPEHIRIGGISEESGTAITECEVYAADVRTGELELPFDRSVTQQIRFAKRMHSEH